MGKRWRKEKEEMREKEHNQKDKWRKFYENWKRVWRNPEISVYTKVILQDVFFYRSDGEGWNISERKFAEDLNISRGRVRKSIKEAIKNGWLLTNGAKERQRRKLRLSGPLRSPAWATRKPNNWDSREPTKYQREYQNNNSSKEDIREGEMTKALSHKEGRKRMEQLRALGKKKGVIWHSK